MTRAQIAYRVADIVDWELQKERRARAKVNKPKPMTREQFIGYRRENPGFQSGESSPRLL